MLLYKGTRVGRDIKEAMEQFRLVWVAGHRSSGYNWTVLLYENVDKDLAIEVFGENQR